MLKRSIPEPPSILSNFDGSYLQVRVVLFLFFKSAFHFHTMKHQRNLDSTLAFSASFVNAHMVSRDCCKSDEVVLEGKVHL